MKKVLLLLVLAACTYAPNDVRYVIDGDTFVLNSGETVRLLGIDAPEKGDPLYDRSAYELQRRITGRQLVLEGDSEDKYGRKLRDVFAEGKHVNLELVKEGWARKYLHQNSTYKALLDNAQEEARAKNKGIWKIDGSGYKRLSERCIKLGCPIGTIAVASKYGDVYYNCACGSALLITPENLICFSTLQDATAAGFRETRKC